MSPHSQNYLGEIVSPPLPQTKGYNIVPPIMNKFYIHGPNFDKKLLTPQKINSGQPFDMFLATSLNMQIVHSCVFIDCI